MSRARIFCGVLLGIWALSVETEAAQYYKYEDDQGAVHYLENPAAAPAKYRDRVRPVEAQIIEQANPRETASQRFWRKALRYKEDLWARWRYPRPALELLPRNVRGIVWFTLKQTRLIYTLAAEVIGVVVLAMALWAVRAYPTRKERRLYAAGILLVYITLFLAAGWFLVLPQLKHFFVQAGHNAEMVRNAGGVDSDQADRLLRFHQFAQTWAGRIP